MKCDFNKVFLKNEYINNYTCVLQNKKYVSDMYTYMFRYRLPKLLTVTYIECVSEKVEYSILIAVCASVRH